VVLAGALITVMNPKTVHAVAAALVEVTNTASNPVVTQSVGQQAGQTIHLVCNAGASSSSGSCYSYVNGVQSSTPYAVPDNQSVVITAVDVYTFEANFETANGYPQCNAGREDALLMNGFEAAAVWEIANSSSPTHFTYPSGVAFPPSSTLVPTFKHYNSALDSTCGEDQLILYGYLTAS
jgi:hypothetical protein